MRHVHPSLAPFNRFFLALFRHEPSLSVKLYQLIACQDFQQSEPKSCGIVKNKRAK